jgi:hypothetical protein
VDLCISNIAKKPDSPNVRVTEPTPRSVIDTGFLVRGIASPLVGGESLWAALCLDGRLFLWSQGEVYGTVQQHKVVEFQIPIKVPVEYSRLDATALIVLRANSEWTGNFDRLFKEAGGRPTAITRLVLEDVPSVVVQVEGFR